MASVSEQRIFFNYQDVDIPLPNYVYNCDLRTYDYNDNVGPGNHFSCDNDVNERYELYLYVDNDNYQLTGYNPGTLVFDIAAQECVNCTSAGTNIQPDFWVD